jgi:large subunit ribosomal protein L3
VFKGKRMAGRMGNDRYTAQNLTVMRIDADKNLIAVKGAVPGVKGGLVLISDASKG